MKNAPPPGDVEPAVIDRLLAAPPETFTALRDELAADLARRGERAAAAALKRVRKPTAAVLAANALAREEPDVARAYLDAVARLEHAQFGLLAEKGDDPAALREAIEEERAAGREVGAALPRALRRAGLDPRPGLVAAALDIVRAAARDRDAAARFAPGRLLEPPPPATGDLLSALLGSTAAGGAPPPPAPPPRKPAPVLVSPPRDAADRERARREAERQAAREAAERAARAAAARRAERRRLEAAATKAQRAAGAAEKKAARAREAAERARKAARAAADLADAAERDARRARAAAEEAARRARDARGD